MIKKRARNKIGLAFATITYAYSLNGYATQRIEQRCFEQLYAGAAPEWLAVRLMSNDLKWALENCISQTQSLNDYNEADSAHISKKLTDVEFRKKNQLTDSRSLELNSATRTTKAAKFSTITSESNDKAHVETLRGYITQKPK